MNIAAESQKHRKTKAPSIKGAALLRQCIFISLTRKNPHSLININLGDFNNENAINIEINVGYYFHLQLIWIE
ncbi:hypothetical protein [Photorhabdus cinerea]|uniref:Uncharacterized protein n=1 Tax=Photorhabdus cinerea TaxID=471575 RepID=A0A7X5QFN1_9GAMM|nr:hypothetical protein [Photorhabdus cinerea]NHB93442.1 hypothetical protein [Photorhabdus cinerea]